MGIHFSKQSKALQEAKTIRQNLYSRVNLIKNKYSELFTTLPVEKKKMISMASASELVRMLDNKQATSQQLVLCFIQRSATIGIQNNYVLDEMFEEAMHEAKKIDQQRNKFVSKKTWKLGMNKQECFPPFYGVPISIKETFLMKDRQTYAGFVSKINPIPKDESCLIELTRNMGFIPFIRTNVPQACKSGETNNNMFGYAKNPWDPTRSTGGSSGGQGGLIASFCSPFGLGSDIGGSLRIPAEFNGLCTLKPAQRSITRLGNAYYGKYSGGSAVKSEFGAITRSVDDLITYHSVMFNPQSYQCIDPLKKDPYLALKPFNDNIFTEKPKLRIGVSKCLQTLKVSDSHERALKICCEALQKEGHEIVDVTLPNLQKLYLLMVQMFTCDQGMGIFDELKKGEPFIKQYKIVALLSKIPWIIRKIIIYFIRKKQPRLATMIEASKPLNVKEIFELIYDSQVTITRQVYETFVKNKADVILIPGFPTCSPKLGDIGKLQYCFALNSSWNVISYPVGSLPVTTVLSSQTSFEDEYNDIYTNAMRKAMKNSTGMPVGVQIASLPQQDEKILYTMKILQDKIKFRQKYTCPVLTLPDNK